MTTRTVAAVDLGAESGRVVSVSFDGQRLHWRTVDRFPHAPVHVDGALRWDVDHLFDRTALALRALAAGTAVASVGVDGWGVDYALLDAGGALVDRPTCYRDPRQRRGMASALRTVGLARLRATSGARVEAINTVFGLHADASEGDRLARADTLLMLPDLVHHRLSGTRATERTLASTTGAYDSAARRWDTDLLADLGVPERILPEVVDAGTDTGPLTGDLAVAGLRGARVVAPAAHDTASAVAATPFAGPGALFCSSGTWSLMGAEVAPGAGPQRPPALSREAGAGNRDLLLRNVAGLWLLQECRRWWAREGLALDYPALAALAAAEPPLRSLVDPDAEEFVAPGDMPGRIRAWCADHGEPVPVTPGAVARCVVDSLALAYRTVVGELTAATGTAPTAIEVTGGGSQHPGLARATAAATGLPVHCGPVEATALGNAGVQLIALGELRDLADLRRVVAASVQERVVEPGDGTGDEPGADAWVEAADRLARAVAAREPQRADRTGRLTTTEAR
ncbi:rhamnulokinase [Kineococcus auxinigenes]|uniref:rhamnulokinase n=1 Tax=unclassified Kineococcus TaxID=2621656 RepID=UPI003D7DBB05